MCEEQLAGLLGPDCSTPLKAALGTRFLFQVCAGIRAKRRPVLAVQKWYGKSEGPLLAGPFFGTGTGAALWTPKWSHFLVLLWAPLSVHAWLGFPASLGAAGCQKTVPYSGPLLGAARTNLCTPPVRIPDPFSGAILLSSQFVAHVLVSHAPAAWSAVFPLGRTGCDMGQESGSFIGAGKCVGRLWAFTFSAQISVQ